MPTTDTPQPGERDLDAEAEDRAARKTADRMRVLACLVDARSQRAASLHEAADTIIRMANERITLTRELAEARAEVGRKEAEIERLYAVVGMGGYQGDAPDEMLLMADAHMGCDAWLYLERMHTMGDDRTNHDPAHHTPPVRYVRAALAPAQEVE